MMNHHHHIQYNDSDGGGGIASHNIITNNPTRNQRIATPTDGWDDLLIDKEPAEKTTLGPTDDELIPYSLLLLSSSSRMSTKHECVDNNDDDVDDSIICGLDGEGDSIDIDHATKLPQQQQQQQHSDHTTTTATTTFSLRTEGNRRAMLEQPQLLQRHCNVQEVAVLLQDRIPFPIHTTSTTTSNNNKNKVTPLTTRSNNNNSKKNPNNKIMRRSESMPIPTTATYHMDEAILQQTSLLTVRELALYLQDKIPMRRPVVGGATTTSTNTTATTTTPPPSLEQLLREKIPHLKPVVRHNHNHKQLLRRCQSDIPSTTSTTTSVSLAHNKKSTSTTTVDQCDVQNNSSSSSSSSSCGTPAGVVDVVVVVDTVDPRRNDLVVTDTTATTATTSTMISVNNNNNDAPITKEETWSPSVMEMALKLQDRIHKTQNHRGTTTKKPPQRSMPMSCCATSSSVAADLSSLIAVGSVGELAKSLKDRIPMRSPEGNSPKRSMSMSHTACAPVGGSNRSQPTPPPLILQSPTISTNHIVDNIMMSSSAGSVAELAHLLKDRIPMRFPVRAVVDINNNTTSRQSPRRCMSMSHNTTSSATTSVQQHPTQRSVVELAEFLKDKIPMRFSSCNVEKKLPTLPNSHRSRSMSHVNTTTASSSSSQPAAAQRSVVELAELLKDKIPMRFGQEKLPASPPANSHNRSQSNSHVNTMTNNNNASSQQPPTRTTVMELADLLKDKIPMRFGAEKPSSDSHRSRSMSHVTTSTTTATTTICSTTMSQNNHPSGGSSRSVLELAHLLKDKNPLRGGVSTKSSNSDTCTTSASVNPMRRAQHPDTSGFAGRGHNDDPDSSMSVHSLAALLKDKIPMRTTTMSATTPSTLSITPSRVAHDKKPFDNNTKSNRSGDTDDSAASLSVHNLAALLKDKLPMRNIPKATPTPPSTVPQSEKPVAIVKATHQYVRKYESNNPSQGNNYNNIKPSELDTTFVSLRVVHDLIDRLKQTHRCHQDGTNETGCSTSHECRYCHELGNILTSFITNAGAVVEDHNNPEGRVIGNSGAQVDGSHCKQRTTIKALDTFLGVPKRYHRRKRKLSSWFQDDHVGSSSFSVRQMEHEEPTAIRFNFKWPVPTNDNSVWMEQVKQLSIIMRDDSKLSPAYHTIEEESRSSSCVLTWFSGKDAKKAVNRIDSRKSALM